MKARLLYFTAKWCAPCREFKPKLQAALAAVPGRFEYVEYDADAHRSTHEAYGITVLPAIVVVSPDEVLLRDYQGEYFVNKSQSETTQWLSDMSTDVYEGGLLPGVTVTPRDAKPFPWWSFLAGAGAVMTEGTTRNALGAVSIASLLLDNVKEATPPRSSQEQQAIDGVFDIDVSGITTMLGVGAGIGAALTSGPTQLILGGVSIAALAGVFASNGGSGGAEPRPDDGRPLNTMPDGSLPQPANYLEELAVKAHTDHFYVEFSETGPFGRNEASQKLVELPDYLIVWAANYHLQSYGKTIRRMINDIYLVTGWTDYTTQLLAAMDRLGIDI